MAKQRGRPLESVPIDNTFGRWLRSARMGRDMTGEELAFEVGGGMTQGRISAYERGDRKPRRETVVSLANALGADPREALSTLMSDTPGVPPPNPEVSALADRLASLDAEDQQRMIDLIDRLSQR